MFEAIDPALQAWANRERLHLATRYRDDEVRAFAVVDDAGGEYDIWVTMAQADPVTVHAWDRESKARWMAGGRPPDVDRLLSAALAEIDAWIRRRGRTRSVY